MKALFAVNLLRSHLHGVANGNLPGEWGFVVLSGKRNVVLQQFDAAVIHSREDAAGEGGGCVLPPGPKDAQYCIS